MSEHSPTNRHEAEESEILHFLAKKEKEFPHLEIFTFYNTLI